MVEQTPHRPSPPGGSRGRGGPDRAGTAAAEEQLLGWTEGKQKDGEEGGAQAVRVAGERVEGTAEGGHEDGVECWRVGPPSPADPSACRASGSGEAAEWRRRRDENRQQRAGAAEQQWTTRWTEPCGGAGGGSRRRYLEEGCCGAVGGRRGPDLSGSGSQAERRLQHEPKTDAVRAKDEAAAEKPWPQAASEVLRFGLEQWDAGGLPWRPGSGSGPVGEAPEDQSWTGFGGSGMRPGSPQQL